MHTRPLGSTGISVSALCLGGWHVGQLTDDDSIALMHACIDEGITFFDNAWDYHEGRSEDLMGRALATGGRRSKVTLM
ncbi:MAG: aldo/keto reductase, partial [Gemmataceae bacterium]